MGGRGWKLGWWGGGSGGRPPLGPLPPRPVGWLPPRTAPSFALLPPGRALPPPPPPRAPRVPLGRPLPAGGGEAAAAAALEDPPESAGLRATGWEG